jgi:hypothetical protein
VVVEGSAVGVEGGGGSFAVGDESFEPFLPEVEEVVDLVHRGEFAGLVGSSPILEVLQRGPLGCGFGLAVRRDLAHVTVVVAELGLGLVLDRLAVCVGRGHPG